MPYVTSYLRALHLLVDEKQQEAARAVMVQETTPALFRYHDAWNSFAQFQMDQMDKAAKDSRAHYARIRVLTLALILIAVIVASGIAVVTTKRTTTDMKSRIGAERQVKELNAALERQPASVSLPRSHTAPQVSPLILRSSACSPPSGSARGRSVSCRSEGTLPW